MRFTLGYRDKLIPIRINLCIRLNLCTCPSSETYIGQVKPPSSRLPDTSIVIPIRLSSGFKVPILFIRINTQLAACSYSN
jgi:hypothetical protein